MNRRQDFFLNAWQACLLVFLFSMMVRLATLNHMGKTWDEPAYVETGYQFVDLAFHGNFTDPFWYIQSDHPPLIRYAYGLAGVLDIKEFTKEGKPVYYYDYTYARLVSVIISSLSSVFIVLLGYHYFSRFVGFSSGVIFSLIPFFVGLSQLATLESFIMFFFTGSIYFYIRFLTEKNIKNAIFSGVFIGLSLLVKQSNVIAIPLIGILGITYLLYRKEFFDRGNIFFHLKTWVIIGITFTTTFFVLWPMPFFNIAATLDVQKTMWVDAVELPPPEVFFGRLMLVPLPYYVVMFFVTTPLVLIVLSLIGALKIDRRKSLIGFLIIIWFLFPFLQSFYAFKQHGLRYIIELYAPFSILCGIGLVYISSFFKKIKHIKLLSLLFVSIYLLVILVKINPYYLDYFNEVVGGNKNIYEKRLFQMGWWGQGIGEATFYIANKESKTVTVAVDGGQPAGVVPNLQNIQVVDYNKVKDADYVLVPYFNVVRLWFPESDLYNHYRVVHTVNVDGVPLVKIYKKLEAKPNFYQIP